MFRATGDFELDDPETWCVIVVRKEDSKPYLRCDKCVLDEKADNYYFFPHSISAISNGAGGHPPDTVNLALLKETWDFHLRVAHNITAGVS